MAGRRWLGGIVLGFAVALGIAMLATSVAATGGFRIDFADGAHLLCGDQDTLETHQLLADPEMSGSPSPRAAAQEFVADLTTARDDAAGRMTPARSRRYRDALSGLDHISIPHTAAKVGPDWGFDVWDPTGERLMLRVLVAEHSGGGFVTESAYVCSALIGDVTAAELIAEEHRGAGR